MLHGSAGIDDPLERVKAATDAMELVRATSATDSPVREALDLYTRVLKGGDQMHPSQADALLTHDLLSEYNDPSYFHEFAAHVERHGLHVFADADVPSMFSRGIPRGGDG